MEYKPLDSSLNELRLLYIEPLEAGLEPVESIVNCSLRHVSLNVYTEEAIQHAKPAHPQSLTGSSFWAEKLAKYSGLGLDAFYAAIRDMVCEPNYGRWEWGDFCALSYTWGSPGDTREIIVDGRKLQVGQNLEAFLRHMRADLTNGKRTGIWIDAICINQQDIDERNTEVKRMGDIYQGASFVIAWLGQETDDSTKALRLLNTISKYNLGSLEDWNSFKVAFRENAEYFEHGAWRSLYNFLNRPYWTRLWIVQEIALAGKGLNIICGNNSINWAHMSDAIGFLSNELDTVIARFQKDSQHMGLPDNISLIIDCIYRVQQLKMFNDVVQTGMDRPLLAETLLTARSSDQQDAKDKVYGVLSLIDPIISKKIMPDYKLSVLQVYTDFAKTCIAETGTLDIICQCRSDLLESDDFPSWVPDWRRKAIVNIELSQKLLYHASKDSKPDISISGNGQNLMARGIRVDVVDGLGFMEELKAPEMKEQVNHPLVQPLSLSNRDSPYGGTHGIRKAILQTFIANRNSWGELPPATYECLVHIPWHDSDALIDYSKHFYFWMFQDMLEENLPLSLGERSLEEYLAVREDEYEMPPEATVLEAAQRAVSVQLTRRLMISANGYIGLATKRVRSGDLICILFGCSTPVLLRPNDGGGFQLVGECYVHGLMEGKAMEWMDEGKYQTEVFNIR